MADTHSTTRDEPPRALKHCDRVASHIWMADLPFCPYCHISQEARVSWVEQDRQREAAKRRAAHD